MDFLNEFSRGLRSVDADNFEAVTLEAFQYQAKHNPVYRAYVRSLGVDVKMVKGLDQLPFLPIEFYKNHEIKTGSWKEEELFYSSGTSGKGESCNYIRDLSLYKQVSMDVFQLFYGPPDQYLVFGLLPSYLERKGSSLVYMVDFLIKNSAGGPSGFFLDNQEELVEILCSPHFSDKKKLLFGVGFALLDLVENHHLKDPNIIVIETGGMKGRKKEIIREEMHEKLATAFHSGNIHSEYGMTELCSQAYAKAPGKFFCPPWMKIMPREINDPFSYCSSNQAGALNIIDLANIHTCCFIETKDLGVLAEDGSFNISGRMDNSDIRGCSLLAQ